MRAGRASRRSERGHAAIVIALSSTALLALTGLALDGGMEAAAYRHAQNAADAGALAAARQEFVNAMASPPQSSTTASLTPVAQKEVVHNNALLAAINGGATVSLGTQRTYAPFTSGGLTGQSRVSDMWATGASLVNTNFNLVQSQGTTNSVAPAGGGSVASSQVELGQLTAAGVTGEGNCFSARAQYVAGANTYGNSTPCPLGSGVSMSGALLGGAATNTEVDSGNAPTAMPRVSGSGVSASVGLTGYTVSTSATSAGAENTLYWSTSSEPVAEGSVFATGVSASAPGITVTTSTLNMQVSITVDGNGNPSITHSCLPTTLVINGTPVPVTADCTPAVALPSIPGVKITMPYVTPSFSPGTACSTDHDGKVTCSVQSCLLRVEVTEIPFNSTLCLAEVVLGFAVVPVTPASFTGAVTVAATVPQQTYFLRIMGWTQTSPTAQGTADLESVIDESQASFTSSPFGMPDTAWAMTSPFKLERLQVGHTYYLYGSSMQSNSPCPACVSGWQGQLSGNHRVGQTTTSVSTLSPPNPQPYTNNGTYYLEPVINPMTQVIEYYAVFLPVAGHLNWGELVNSIPAVGGHLVQATSTSGWISFDQGAVAVKLAL